MKIGNLSVSIYEDTNKSAFTSNNELTKFKNIKWNGKKLKVSYWYSFQIIYKELVCDITWNNKNFCEFFLSKIVTKF